MPAPMNRARHLLVLTRPLTALGLIAVLNCRPEPTVQPSVVVAEEVEEAKAAEGVPTPEEPEEVKVAEAEGGEKPAEAALTE